MVHLWSATLPWTSGEVTVWHPYNYLLHCVGTFCFGTLPPTKMLPEPEFSSFFEVPVEWAAAERRGRWGGFTRILSKSGAPWPWPHPILWLPPFRAFIVWEVVHDCKEYPCPWASLTLPQPHCTLKSHPIVEGRESCSHQLPWGAGGCCAIVLLPLYHASPLLFSSMHTASSSPPPLKGASARFPLPLTGVGNDPGPPLGAICCDAPAL